MKVIKNEGHKNNFFTSLQDLYENEALVDVTLINEDVSIKAHKVVLASGSPYFRKLLATNPSKHPIVLMNGVDTNNLKALLNFLYTGETSVEDEKIASFELVANNFHIVGLAAAIEEAKGKLAEVVPQEAISIKSAGDVRKTVVIMKSPSKSGTNSEEVQPLVETINESGDETIKEKPQDDSIQFPPVPTNSPVTINSFKGMPIPASTEHSSVLDMDNCKRVNEEFHLDIPKGHLRGDYYREYSVDAQAHFENHGEARHDRRSYGLESDTTVTTQNEIGEQEDTPCGKTFSESTPSVFKSSEQGSKAPSNSLLGQDFTIFSKPYRYTSENKKFTSNDIYLMNPNTDLNLKEIFAQSNQAYSSYTSDASNTSITDLKCFICEKSFTQTELLQVHYKENHFPISYPCPWCMNKGLRPIKKIQSAENVKFFTYLCCYCKKVFGSKQYLN